jgi:hypothetical protein
MRLAAPLALLLVAGLVACGASHVNQRKAVRQAIRATELRAGPTQFTISGIRISKLDPRYAVAQEQYTGHPGPTGASTWILRRSGSTWRATSVEITFTVCSAAPRKVLRELTGTSACYPPIGVYTAVPWTRGTSARLRYCLRPGVPGNFIAASEGVTCPTAWRVVYAVTGRCHAVGSCAVAGYECRSYWNGRYAGTFAVDHHALCTSGQRRVEWDGG